MVKQFAHKNKLLIVGPYMGLYLGDVSNSEMIYKLEPVLLNYGFNVQTINVNGKNYLFIFKTEKLPRLCFFTRKKLTAWLDNIIEQYESTIQHIQQKACYLSEMPAFSVPSSLSRGTPKDELFNSVRYAFTDKRIFVFHMDIRGKYIPFYEYGFLFLPLCGWIL